MFLKFTVFGYKGIGQDCYIVTKRRYLSKKAVIGDYSFVAEGCYIYPNVSVGRFALIAPRVNIVGGDHNFLNKEKPMCFSGRSEIKRTYIGDDVWVGQSATIMAGVSIGSGSIIAAGSVVSKDVEPYSIVGGNPAKKLRNRFSKEDRELHEKAIGQIDGLEYLVKDL